MLTKRYGGMKNENEIISVLWNSLSLGYSFRLFRLQESGIILHWGLSMEASNSKYMRPYFKIVGTVTNRPKKISVQNLGGAFWLLLIGLGAAAIALIYENLIHLRKFCNDRVRRVI